MLRTMHASTHLSTLRVRGAGCLASKPLSDECPLPPAPPAPAATAEPAALIQDLGDAPVDTLHVEVMDELRQLDQRLIEALECGDVRLLRGSWLRSLPTEYQLQNRQALEALEEGGISPSELPLLQPSEAVALIKRGTRCVGALSHGWLSAAHCDPCAARVSVVVKAFKQHTHLEALFWGALHGSPSLSADCLRRGMCCAHFYTLHVYPLHHEGSGTHAQASLLRFCLPISLSDSTIALAPCARQILLRCIRNRAPRRKKRHSSARVSAGRESPTRARCVGVQLPNHHQWSHQKRDS